MVSARQVIWSAVYATLAPVLLFLPILMIGYGHGAAARNADVISLGIVTIALGYLGLIWLIGRRKPSTSAGRAENPSRRGYVWATIWYWFIGVEGAGFLVFLLGDCGTGGDLTACLQETGLASRLSLSLLLLGYGALLCQLSFRGRTGETQP